MKIYRLIIGGLLVIFIAATVIYMAYFYNGQDSSQQGTLIWRETNVSANRLC